MSNLTARIAANLVERAQLQALADVEDQIARVKRAAIAHGIPAEELERVDREAEAEARKGIR